jgi:hypothetical protein
MKESKVVLARRAVLKTAGLGVGAGLLSGAATPAQAASNGEIWSAEYWTRKGDIRLCFRKRLGAPKAGEAPRPVLFLVHGSSVTWRIFDLDTARPWRILNDECERAMGLRCLDHGSRN